MSKHMKFFFLAAGALLALGLVAPQPASAFEAIKCGESEYTVWGFLRNNLGMFTQTQEFAENGNQLATARTWLRTYGRAKFNPQASFFIATQFAHEPWYPVEEGARSSRYAHNYRHPKEDPGAVLHSGEEYSEYDNINDVLREVYFDWTPSNTHKFRIGRQIVIWGEALTSRVGDVIHPDDGRFAFAFSNLEDTRIPQWMIRGIHDFEVGSASANFEWLVNPLITSKEYRVTRGANPASVPQQRFAPHPEDRTAFVGGNWAPPTLFLGISEGIIPNSVETQYPDSNWDDMRYGGRTTFSLQGVQFGFSYFHTQNYLPLFERGAVNVITPSFATADYIVTYTKNYDIFGVFANKQLTSIPGVLRTEAVYSPNMPYDSFNCGPGENCIIRRDNVKYLLAWDLNSYFYFQWKKDAPIDITIEHTGEWTPNNKDIVLGGGYMDVQPEYSGSIGGQISTSWLYGIFKTAMIVAYITDNDAGLFMPSVTWTPLWQNSRFSMELKYIGIYGNTPYRQLGLFKNKDMVLLTTQLNF